ncbi:HlyIII-domain-containing protein [Pseudovirgaria hyperparasitica]|uniref:HlyIII-domain-containing protein n=1 Tax=Pseudovirgaria hyperparasitica TaxID=470096 RepID=A0A6A6WEN2_9PEZI|nr:HlyIII-domain-containing protein [Pseudovirgaria hyperparasitica]KAF2761282.1 HlyIII-domain-containing protein [Pseudovirgaria hyperparasitica]
MDAMTAASKEAVESLSNIAQKTTAKIEDRLTVLWPEIEEWQQDNHYIWSGYRPASNSFSRSFGSLGYIHNETVNIYTHLLGAVVAVIGAIAMYNIFKPRYDLATSEDVIAFSCFFVGATACLGMSATFHTISNHSHSVAAFGNKLDYLGILCLIWGSYVPTLYYGFQRDERLVKIYTGTITANCFGTAMLCIMPRFRTAAFRPLRAGMFVLTGLTGVIPVVHGVFLHGWPTMETQMALSWVISQGTMYIIGAGIYAARVPERFFPGKFDIWGSSHQIFHCFVVAAAAIHFVGLVKAFDHWHGLRATSPHMQVFKDYIWWK